jgi:hypothetical protein
MFWNCNRELPAGHREASRTTRREHAYEDIICRQGQLGAPQHSTARLTASRQKNMAAEAKAATRTICAGGTIASMRAGAPDQPS